MPKTPLKVATPSKENKKLQYSNLISHIGLLLEQAKSHFIKQVNTTMTEMYRNIGKYIVEYEQKGEDKAEYGSGLLKKLSTDLTQQFGKGYSYYNLNFMRNAYLAFPIFETLSQKSNALSWSHIVFLCQIKDEFERNFYLIEASHEQRSLRELKRQFNSALYERLALSKDKNKVMKLASEGQIITTPSEVLKDPYIFEFL
jgi:predicted nuclease of restriction endonuclease-like (RecB) superfamily